jgi:hypothetical protein
MSMHRELPRAVQPKIPWQVAAMFSLVAFSITILAIQLWGQHRSSLKSGNETLTVIVEQFPAAAAKGKTIVYTPASSTPSKYESRTTQYLKNQVTTPEFLRQAWCESQKSTGKQASLALADAEVEKIRQSLSVEIEDSPLAGKRLRLTLTGQNSRDAARFLKTLGDRFAAQYRTGMTNDRNQEYAQTQTTAQAAWEALDNAWTEFQYFDRYLQEQSALSHEKPRKTAKQLAPAQPVAQVAAVPYPTTAAPRTESSEQIELQQKVAGLRKNLAALLEKRTPQHPEVVFLQDEVRELEARLAAMSQPAVAEVLPKTPAVVETPVVQEELPEPAAPSVAVETISASDTLLLAQLQYRVYETATAYGEAFDRETLIADQANLAPQIAVACWKSPGQKASVSTPMQRPFGWLLGVSMAFGVGLIFSSKAVEPPLASLDELRRRAPIPILGVVPSYDSSEDPHSIKRKKQGSRVTLLVTGLALVGFCFWSISRII